MVNRNMARDASNLAVTITGVALLLVVGGVAWFGIGADQAAPRPSVTPSIGEPLSDIVRVHVSGSVVSPGVVELDPEAIVADAVRAAGGALSSADLTSINLAAKVRTGERIVVPETAAKSGGGVEVADSGLDLNTATVPQLETLPGVGPVLAERIIAHRLERGPFVKVEDLLDVPGIGEAKLSQMRDAIAYP